jgi:hypothetical protein
MRPLTASVLTCADGLLVLSFPGALLWLFTC